MLPVQLDATLCLLWAHQMEALSLQLAGSEARYADIVHRGRASVIGAWDDLAMQLTR